jgi:hypothetical protein
MGERVDIYVAPSQETYVLGSTHFVLALDELEAVADYYGPRYLPRPLWPPQVAGLAFSHGKNRLLDDARLAR